MLHIFRRLPTERFRPAPRTFRAGRGKKKQKETKNNVFYVRSRARLYICERINIVRANERVAAVMINVKNARKCLCPFAFARVTTE
jgi:hypothetical protein